MRKKIGILGLFILLVFTIMGTHKTGEYLYENYMMEGRSQVDAGTPTSAEAAGSNKAEEKKQNVKISKKVVTVDAGHGGSDPGKVGINKALEKDINLQIAKKVEALLLKQNVEVVMTRQDEQGIAESKAEDMKRRVSIINETKPDLAVSIHQNSYQEESIHGAQVFYFTHSKKGEAAANILQASLLSVDTENKRQAKANDTYYMLVKTESPLVIIECGFLSNQAEADKLLEEEYQDAMAQAICKGVMEYLEK